MRPLRRFGELQAQTAAYAPHSAVAQNSLKGSFQCLAVLTGFGSAGKLGLSFILMKFSRAVLGELFVVRISSKISQQSLVD
jgi:hypothetical protein